MSCAAPLRPSPSRGITRRTPSRPSRSRVVRCPLCPHRKYHTPRDLALHILVSHGTLHLARRRALSSASPAVGGAAAQPDACADASAADPFPDADADADAARSVTCASAPAEVDDVPAPVGRAPRAVVRAGGLSAPEAQGAAARGRGGGEERRGRTETTCTREMRRRQAGGVVAAAAERRSAAAHIELDFADV